MRRWIYLLVLSAVWTVMVGCAVSTVQHNPFQSFPNRHNVYDLQFAWDTASRPDGFDVRGVVMNVRYAAVDDLTLFISLLDQENREVARQTYFVIPQQVPMDEWRDFRVTFRQPPPPNGKLRFLYKYRAIDSNDSFDWMNSFDVDLASGAVIQER